MSYGKTKIKVSHEYSGMPDYWGGNGRRWDDDAGCLFAYYGRNTSLRDCVDQWVDEFFNGGDCDSLPHNITENDLRDAILEAFTEQGRADYHSGAIAECSADFAAINGPPCCFDCEQELGEAHLDDCSFCDGEVVEEDCENEFYDSPFWVILVEVEEYSILDNFDEWFERVKG